MSSQADDILEAGAKTYREKNAVYGDNYKKVGHVMVGLFPDGLTVATVDDWNRLHIMLLEVVKMTRYVQNWAHGGHSDSNLDRAVYAAMLESIDMEIRLRPRAGQTKPPVFITETSPYPPAPTVAVGEAARAMQQINPRNFPLDLAEAMKDDKD